MWTSELPAFVPFFVGALLALLTRGHLRSFLMLAVVAVSGLHLWLLPGHLQVSLFLFDVELTPYRVDSLSLVFGYVFHIAAFISVLYAIHVRDTMQHVSGLLYAGSAIGAILPVTSLPFLFSGSCWRSVPYS
jgi:multicomponent Na+:H+ antiporter subunit D